MLPAAHRLRRSVDFERTVRRGTRAGRSTVVVHLLVPDESVSDAGSGTPQVGFVVSKAVGNSVQRNLVKRRLRAAAAEQLSVLPGASRTVVRALPASSSATYADLERDLDSCLRRAVARATGDGKR
ncbi:ribonuclease P protein component [Promicromonospora iranensis]|jgi:ribonuclease P protein component|uniref:ribonuclease P protein component n=1 Tax=Promicromonospora iranensis TaxID=1105144 RepID=UPI0023AA0FA3|nr:ribonuclease P protein component [Promicromonospora iranensis]